MKALFKFIIVTLMVGSLAACSSNPVIQDYSSQTQFSNYQAYQWLPSANKRVDGNQPFMAQRIEQSIIKNLTQRGAMMVRNQPQAFVDFSYRITRTESIEPTSSIGLGWGARHFGFRTMFPINYETHVYETANWAINIYDANQKLIWQGKTSRPVEPFADPKEAEAYTQAVVDEILNNFPPK